MLLLEASRAVQEEVGSLLTPGSSMWLPLLTQPFLPLSLCLYVANTHLPLALKTLRLCFIHMYIPRAKDIVDLQPTVPERMN